MSDSTNNPVEGSSPPVIDAKIDEQPPSDSPASNEAVDEDGSPDLAVNALEEIELGKRALALKDIRDAAEHFSLACELLDTLYGPGSRECAEAYVIYGSTLLEVSRLDNCVVDNSKLPANDDEDDDDEEEADEEGDAPEVPQAEEKVETAKDGASKESGAPEVEAETAAAAASISAFEDPQPSTSKGETSEQDGEKDDMSDAELAWAILNMARTSYENGEQSRDNATLHAEALQKLGEISLEWDNPENAIELFSECLVIRKENDVHPRVVAQTYHFLALAYASKNSFVESVACIQDAMNLLETFINNTQEAFEDETDSAKKAALKAEMEEVEAILPEVQLQLEEYQIQQRTGYQSLQALENEVDEKEKQTVARICDAGDKPVQDISHLVKRKPAPVAENGSATSSEATKVNGNSVADVKRKIEEVDENSDPKETVKKLCADDIPAKSIDESSEVSAPNDNII